MRKLIHYFIFQKHSAFMPLRYAYPECSFLIEPHTAVEPLQCFKMDCPANQNCAEIIARRVHYLFEEVLEDTVQMLFLYFKLRNKGFYSKNEWVPSLGAGVFHRDMREPKWMLVNRWGFNNLKDKGVKMSWLPSDEFLFIKTGSDILIPDTELIRD